MDILHLKAPGCWINDPNGFIYYKGKYHLFYQCFPYAAIWGTMHWGHAVSEDLIHWEHLGIALFPTKSYDANGVFSGNAIEIDGKMVLYYTGVKYLAQNPENCHLALHDLYECSQVRITSEDGYHFDNYHDKELVYPVFSDAIGNYNHTKDPKVWKKKDNYYMILGSTNKLQVGRLIVSRSKDSVNWNVVSVLEDARLGQILECPDLFEMNGKYYLLASAINKVTEAEGYDALTVCGQVDFDEESGKVSLTHSLDYVDYGEDLYATQTTLDKEGRRVFLSWMRMPSEIKDTESRKEWNGMMCSPRVLGEQDGKLTFDLHPDVRSYFSEKLTEEEKTAFFRQQRGLWLGKTRMKNGDRINIGGYRIWMENHVLYADRTEVFEVGNTPVIPKKQFELPLAGEDHELTIVVDDHLIEIYVDHGKYVLSNVVYHLGEQVSGQIQEIYVPVK